MESRPPGRVPAHPDDHPMLRIRAVDADVDGFAAALVGLLDAHAAAAGHRLRPRALAFAAHAGGERVGGVYASQLHGWVMVKYLAVTEASRGRGIGTALMRRVEDEAAAQGALGVFVDTYGFQAPRLYARLGYTEMGRLATPDPARTRHFFVKTLAPLP